MNCHEKEAGFIRFMIKFFRAYNKKRSWVFESFIAANKHFLNYWKEFFIDLSIAVFIFMLIVFAAFFLELVLPIFKYHWFAVNLIPTEVWGDLLPPTRYIAMKRFAPPENMITILDPPPFYEFLNKLYIWKLRLERFLRSYMPVILLSNFEWKVLFSFIMMCVLGLEFNDFYDIIMCNNISKEVFVAKCTKIFINVLLVELCILIAVFV